MQYKEWNWFGKWIICWENLFIHDKSQEIKIDKVKFSRNIKLVNAR